METQTLLECIKTVITSDTSQVVLLLLTALGALAAAIFTQRAARVTSKANSGQTLLACLDKYIAIMKDKREAETKGDVRLAKEFYRELFDLHWGEFHLWHNGAIPNDVMKAWASVRSRNFRMDKINCTTDKVPEEITYKDEWKDQIDSNYFEKNDPFVYFMNRIHNGYNSDIKELKKETKKWK